MVEKSHVKQECCDACDKERQISPYIPIEVSPGFNFQSNFFKFREMRLYPMKYLPNLSLIGVIVFELLEEKGIQTQGQKDKNTELNEITLSF